MFEVSQLPSTGFLRLNQVLKLIPLRPTRWFEGVKTGEFPRPIKLGRTSLYRIEDILALIERLSQTENSVPQNIQPDK